MKTNITSSTNKCDHRIWDVQIYLCIIFTKIRRRSNFLTWLWIITVIGTVGFGIIDFGQIVFGAIVFVATVFVCFAFGVMTFGCLAIWRKVTRPRILCFQEISQNFLMFSYRISKFNKKSSNTNRPQSPHTFQCQIVHGEWREMFSNDCTRILTLPGIARTQTVWPL